MVAATHPIAPPVLERLRTSDDAGRILGGRTVELPQERAGEVDGILAEMFTDPAVALVHVRAVAFGCFMAGVRPRPLR